MPERVQEEINKQRAEFNLSVQKEVHGTWRSSVVLPCFYSPVHCTPQSVTWRLDGQMILARDDHTFLTKHIGRLSLPWERQGGDVSLTIQNLQVDDGGQYSCEVFMKLNGTSDLLKKEAFINLDVTKVAVTKPLIQPEESFLEVSEGASVNLTCSAEGSPPITYRWYKRDQAPGSRRVFQSGGALFLIENFQTSHSGTYYCEAKNRIPAKKAQQSDGVHLSITDDTIAKVTTPKSGMVRTDGAVLTEWSGSTHRNEAPSSANGFVLEVGGSLLQGQSSSLVALSIPQTEKFICQLADSSAGEGLPLFYIILPIVLRLAFFFNLIVALEIQRQRRKTSISATIPDKSEGPGHAIRAGDYVFVKNFSRRAKVEGACSGVIEDPNRSSCGGKKDLDPHLPLQKTVQTE
ncbi:uncharacterized protein LOC144752162 [Lissotriton helveticus]